MEHETNLSAWRILKLCSPCVYTCSRGWQAVAASVNMRSVLVGRQLSVSASTWFRLLPFYRHWCIYENDTQAGWTIKSSPGWEGCVVSIPRWSQRTLMQDEVDLIYKVHPCEMKMWYQNQGGLSVQVVFITDLRVHFRICVKRHL